MYSRKYIRPAMAAGSITPEQPTPPPDYAGVAFRTSDARTRTDFPETVIPAIGKTDEGTALTLSEPTDTRSMTAPSGVPSPDRAEPMLASDRTEGMTEGFDRSDDLDGYYDEAEPERTDHPRSPDETTPDDSVYTPEKSEALSQGDAPIFSLPSPDEQESDSLASPTDNQPLDWLRALKMEDLMLFWLLLMLLYGEANEEIELLLCLLLFAGS